VPVASIRGNLLGVVRFATALTPLLVVAALEGCGDESSDASTRHDAGADAGAGGTAGSVGGSGGAGAASGGSAGAAAAGSGGTVQDGGTDAPACPGTPVEHAFVPLPDDVDVENPERGFHGWIELLGSSNDYRSVRDDGMTLAYAGVSLLDHADGDIDQGTLDELTASLARVRSAGIKVILRFFYRDSFTAPTDAPLDRVLAHIAQLEPVIQANADVVAFLEAGFVGPWGEWHATSNALDAPAAQKAILDALLAAAPTERMVLVRKWSFKLDHAGGPVTAAEAFSGTARARLGHHNDCFLSSDDDVGTYPSGQIEAWKTAIAEDTRFVPIGGETCADYPARTNCATATAEMGRLHFSFLNSIYEPNALARFESEGCYDEIRARLGYRLVLDTARFVERAKRGCALEIELGLRNTGYAPPYNPRKVLLVLDGPQRFEAELAVDPRRWEPGAHQLTESVALPVDLAPGSYRASLFLPDSSPALADREEYAIRFANEGIWTDGAGLNVIANEIVIE
jgi:hypothetical protein